MYQADTMIYVGNRHGDCIHGICSQQGLEY